MAAACALLYNTSSWKLNSSHCPAYFDRISCWPPTEAGVRRMISCPISIFPHADKNAYASLLCTNESRWEAKSRYDLCIGCSPVNYYELNTTLAFSIPDSFLKARKYFIVSANTISVVFLSIAILILLCNSRLRRYSRYILHLNIFLVFLTRSIIKLIAYTSMDKGYFAHNVFERTDPCNRTTIYYKAQLLDCKLFVILMNYINNGVVHWFVFFEALYLYRLLRSEAYRDKIRWYILTGWIAPLCLTIITYLTRFIAKQDLDTCWFEPSVYDWILHGPNVILQILNFLIFTFVCTLLFRKINETYKTRIIHDHRRFAKYSRLTRSTLILLPMFGIHYFLFLWNTQPLLIPSLILIHLTVHTISSSLQGSMVAVIYTVVNGEVRRELLRSMDRYLLRHYPLWNQPKMYRYYMSKMATSQFYSLDYSERLALPSKKI